MRAASVCVACLALRSAAAFHPHAGASLVADELSGKALSEPPAREGRLSVAQISERRAAPGVTIKYVSTLHNDADAGDDNGPLPGAVRQMRRKTGGDDLNWEHGRWLNGLWKKTDDGEIPWNAWDAFNKSHDRAKRGTYCQYDCATRCGFTWDDAAAKVGPPCQRAKDCRPRPPGSAAAGWSHAQNYSCFEDLPDYKRGLLGECVSKDTRAKSDAYCAVVCGTSPASCDLTSCTCTRSAAWDLTTKIERHDDSTPPERMPNKSLALVEETRRAYQSTVSGLPACQWRPGGGCSNVTQYECFDGPSAGRCSAHNWMYNPSCIRSCVHVSTLSPAPYYALWVDGPEERRPQRGERQPRYAHAESKMTPERRGIKLRVSDVLMSRMCKSVANRFVGVTLYSSAFENKARRLVRSCELVGICCKATNLPHDAFGPGAPEGSEEFRFQAIAMKPSFLLSEMEANELPVVFLDCDLEFHKFPALFIPGSWPRYGRDVALFNFWANETLPETRNRPHIGSGVAFFNRTKPARDLLNAWAEAMAYPPNERAPDDQVLDLLLTEGEWLKRASYGWLPTSYLRTMPSYYRGVDPVIDHNHGSPPGLVVGGPGSHSDTKPQMPRVKVMQLRYPSDGRNKGLPLQLSMARAEAEWETLKEDSPYWKVAPPTDCWQPLGQQRNCPTSPTAANTASGPVTIAPEARAEHRSEARKPASGRCVREWQTEISKWFSPLRDATEGDCSYACTHERSTWCVGYEFTPEAAGTCKLYDDCTGDGDDSSQKADGQVSPPVYWIPPPKVDGQAQVDPSSESESALAPQGDPLSCVVIKGAEGPQLDDDWCRRTCSQGGECPKAVCECNADHGVLRYDPDDPDMPVRHSKYSHGNIPIQEKARLRAAGVDGFDAPAAAEAVAVPDVADAVAEAIAIADAVAGAAVAAPQNENLRKVEAAPRCDCKWASSNACTAPSDDGSRCWSQCCSLFKASVLNRLKDVWR